MLTLPSLLLVLAAAPPIPVEKGPARAEQAVAQVLLLSGGPTVRHAKGEVPLASGMLLEATDELRVPPGAWLTLSLLANARVVRLDDDLALRVDELAVFKAPMATTQLEQQLNQLLTASEQKANETRLTGWKVGASGARPNSPSPQRGAGGGGKGPPTGTNEVMVPPPRDLPTPLPSPPPPPKATKEATKEAALTWDAGLQACLRSEYAAVGLLEAHPTVHVELALSNGEVRVRLPRAFPPPACLRAWAEHQRSQLGTRWLTLTVPLGK